MTKIVVGFMTKRALPIVPNAAKDHQTHWLLLDVSPPLCCVPRHTGSSFHVRGGVINNAQGKMVVNISSGHISSQFSVQTQLKT